MVETHLIMNLWNTLAVLLLICITGESQPILRQVLTTNATPIVGGTNVVVVNNGTNLSINTPGGGTGSALPWTAVATNLTAGKIPVIGTQKTNLQEAASSDLQSNLGNVYQSTNAALTALSANANLYQATNGNLTTLAGGDAKVNATVVTNSALFQNVTASRVGVFDSLKNLTNVVTTGILKGDGTAAALTDWTNTAGIFTGGTTTFLRADGTMQTPGGASDNWSASGTTNSSLPGQAFMDSLRVTNNSQVAHIGVGVAADPNTPVLVDRSGIGATPSDGITLTNATAAGSGAQQYSPAIHFGGQGFKTDVTTGSQPLDWRVYVQPIQGAGNPTSQLNFDSSVNGAAFANKFQLLSNGGVISVASVSCGASSKFAWTGLSAMTAPLDGYIQLANTAGSGFTQLRLGVDSATPSATVTIRSGGSRGGTDTDTAGGSLLLSGSQATGTGAGGALKFATYGSSNSTGNAIGPQTIRAFASAKYVTLTEASATLIGNVAVPSGKFVGVQMFCTVNATDGTDFQALSSRVSFDAVNKGGTVTVGAVTQTDNAAAVSSGTLTPVTYTAVANGNGVDIKCAATSSLTQTILQCRWHITSMNSDDVATVTPQ